MRYEKEELQQKQKKLKRKHLLVTSLVLGIIALSIGGIVLVTSEDWDEKDASTSKTQQTSETTSEKGQNHLEKVNEAVYPTLEIQEALYSQTPYKEKVVFLTFDDGTNTVITPKVLDVLKEKEVPATFFVVGNQISQETKDVLVRELEEGHSIGIHSFNHNYDELYPSRNGNKEAILTQFQQTHDLLQEALGKSFATKVWRYPGGHMSWNQLEEADAALMEKGVHWMDWNSAVGDAVRKEEQPKTAVEMVEYLKKSLTEFPNNGIHVVLMHDAPDKALTLEALPQIIDYFKGEGFKFGIFE